MTLALIFIFLAGIGNFAMHRALFESGDAIIKASVAPVQRAMGRYTSYAFEFVLLLMTMSFSQSWPVATLILYGLYTMINAIVFALLTNRRR